MNYLSSDQQSGHPGQVTLHCEFTAGASGAVPAKFTRYGGMVSCVLSGTGLYTFTAGESYVSLLNVLPTVQQATYNAAHGSTARLSAEAVNSATPTVAMQVVDGAGNPVALTSGDKFKMTFVFASKPGNG